MTIYDSNYEPQYPFPVGKMEIELTCDKCGDSYTLAGRQRSDHLNNRRKRPNLRNLCPVCWPLAGRRGQMLTPQPLEQVVIDDPDERQAVQLVQLAQSAQSVASTECG